MRVVAWNCAALGAIGLSSACVSDPGEVELEDEVQLAGSPALHQQLARARAASARYHDVDVALAEGFVPSGDCVEVPGLGAMGVHFVKFPRLADPPAIDEPEALLYLPHADEGWRLIGIEHLSPIVIGGAPYMGCGIENESCPPASPPPSPEIYDGVLFDGPMAGHQPGMPWHYDQHVWVWRHNPDGMFAQFNPALACP